LRFAYADTAQHKSAADRQMFARFFAFIERVKLTGRSTFLVPLFVHILHQNHPRSRWLKPMHDLFALERRERRAGDHERDSDYGGESTSLHGTP